MVNPVWRALALWTLAAAPVSAAAQAVSSAPSAASVTIYRDANLSSDDLTELDRSRGLALITETRTVEAPAGRSRISFQGVADTLVPQTVAIEGLPGEVRERNEDFDLLSPGSLVERSVGQTVRVVQTDGRRGKVTERSAVIRSGPDGVVLDFDGRIEALGCGGPPVRLVFDREPQGLGDKPTFSVLADLPQAGRYTVRLSYLATGFSWSADYVAHIAPNGRTLDLSGWLTLSNKSSVGFAQAPTQVVAGQLQRDDDTAPPTAEAKAITAACWGQIVRPARFAAAPMVERRMEAPGVVEELAVTAAKRQAVLSELGDYKLYTLPEPTTVAARQTKQVAFLEQTHVPFARIYSFTRNGDVEEDPEAGPRAPDVLIRMQNKPGAGLGKPLPSGRISVMEPAPGGPVLAGENTINDTPVGLPVEFRLGAAMDVRVAPKVEHTAGHGRRVADEVTVAFENDKPVPVVIEYHEPRVGKDFEVTRASRRSVPKAGDEVWTIALKAGERAQLSYRVSYD
jgi:hypothetical protein